MKREAVSEVVGAFLIIAVAVLALAIVGLVLTSAPLPASVPSFSAVVTLRGTTIYISHEGGDPLRRGQYQVLVDGVDETANFVKSFSDPWSSGKVMNHTLSSVPRRVVMVYNSSWGGGTILLASDLSLPIGSCSAAGWYSSSWRFRKNITLWNVKVNGTLSSFPVLIKLDSDSNLSSSARQDGYDILFTDGTGRGKIPHEIEQFTSGTGALIAWVRVPTVTNTTNTTIYMYYNNSGAPDQQDKYNVWDSDYRGVWHLKEYPPGTYVMNDSTLNDNDGTPNGGMDSSDQVNGKIDGSLDFDGSESPIGSGDYIRVNDSAILHISSYVTAEAWVKPDSISNWDTVVAKYHDSGMTQRDIYLGASTGNSNVKIQLCGPLVACSGVYDTNVVLSTGSWQHLVLTNNNSHVLFYKDGALRYATAGSGTLNLGTSTDPFWMGGEGGRASYPVEYFDGLIDEVRISSTNRSSDWISTEYNNQVSPSTFHYLNTAEPC